MSVDDRLIDQKAVEAWLEQFATVARSRGESNLLDEIFLEEPYWRDALALSWQLTTWYGREQIREGLQAAALEIESVELEPEYAMQWANRNGLEHLEVPYR